MGATKQKTVTKADTTQNQTQTAAPPTWTLPGLTDAAGLVTSAMHSLPTEHYSGPMTATYNPADVAAIQNAWGSTAANASDLAGWMQNTTLPALSVIANGPSWSTQLPTQQVQAAGVQDANAAIQAAMYPAMHELQTSILPGITNSALASGAYTSDRALGVLPTQAISNAMESMQRTGATMGYQAYEDWANRDLNAQQFNVNSAQQNYSLDTQRQMQQAGMQLQALGMTPDMVNAILHTGASAGDLLNMAAQLGVNANQQNINNAVGMDQYASQAPFMGLDTASQLLAQLSGNWGTQTMNGASHTNQTQTTSQQSPMAMQLLQAGIGAAMMAAGMPQGASVMAGAASGGAGAQPMSGASLFNMQQIAGLGG